MKTAHLLTFHWGWLSPASWQQLRQDQGPGYLAYLRTLPPDRFGRIAFTHAGWLFDAALPPAARRIPGQETEPTLHIAPFTADEVAAWRAEVDSGRLEPVTYYYAPLVAEQVTGELLLRAIRYARETIQRQLGASPVALAGHDPFTMMQWGTPQQVQLAALTGHEALMAGTECTVVALDGTRLRCIGIPLLRYGLESLAAPMLERLEKEGQAAFFFATEMHWHHRTNPFGRALDQVRARFGQVQFVPCTVGEWMQQIHDWPDVPAAGVGTKGWNGGGPDQMQIEQAVRACEALLPGIEALDALHGGGRRAAAIQDLWKRCICLSDNHIRWFIHDNKRIYLPAARALLDDARALARQLATALTPAAGASPRLVVWNLLGWPHAGVAEAEVTLPPGYAGVTLRGPGGEAVAVQVTPLARDDAGHLRRARLVWQTSPLPPWGYAVYQVLPAAALPVAPAAAPSLALENARLRVDFAANGEMVTLRDKATGQTMQGGHRLLNIVAQPDDTAYEAAGGQPLAAQGHDGRGCFRAWVDVTVPEVEQYTLDLDEMHGGLLLVEIEMVGRDGRRLAPPRRVPVVNLHWMGPLHRATGAQSIPLGEIAAGTHFRVTLWFLSEGDATLGMGAVRSQRHHLPIERWQVQWVYRLAPTPGKAVAADVVERGAVRQRLRFRGRLPQCTYETTATLEGGADAHRIDFETRFTFEQPTALGIPTPPLPPEVGSYLGSNCERPYIPGLAVTFPAPAAATATAPPELLVDVPYALLDPMRHVHPTLRARSWLADYAEPVQDFYWGLTPFTAIRLAWAPGWGMLMAGGMPHFFLWRNLYGQGERSLGLSFGASLVHPRTVTKRLPPTSEWFDLARGPSYGDFQDGYDHYEFNHPQGTYTYRYSLSLAGPPLDAWREAQQAALPPLVVTAPVDGQASSLPSILSVDAANVALTGCEWLGETSGLARWRVRFVEMLGKATTFTLRCQHPIEQVEACALPMSAQPQDAMTVQVGVPAYAVRELTLTVRRTDDAPPAGKESSGA